MVIINIPRSHIVLVVLFWNKNINVCYLRTPFSLTKDSVRRTHLQLQLQISTSRYESKKRGIVGGCASWFLRLNYKCKKKKQTSILCKVEPLSGATVADLIVTHIRGCIYLHITH